MKNCTIDLSDRLPLPEKKLTKAEKAWQAQVEKVKAGFAADGYVLRDEYRNSGQRLKITCKNGHDHEISWSVFRRGGRCGVCSGRVKPKELCIKAFESCGYTVLGEYKGTKDPVLVRCEAGHEREITYNSIRLGARCLKCSKVYVDPDFIKKTLEENGYEMLEEYKNSSTPMRVKCSNGHEIKCTWDHFKQGHRCAVCAKMVVTHEDVKAAFETRGYTLLSTYKKSKQKLEYICPKSHRRSIVWDSFKAGNGCAECAGMIVHHVDVQTAFEAEGYTLLSTYKTCDQKLKYICPQSHQHEITWTNFKTGYRCGVCSPGGYSSSLPGRIYYVRFTLPDGCNIWKIGITNLTVKSRFLRENTPYEIIWQQRFEDGRIPRQMEREMLKKHRRHKYKGDALLSGNTECFTRDVLGYDTGRQKA
ncbi:MAG: hypothetical protein ACRC62_22975 [Microcoleus sp.]